MIALEHTPALWTGPHSKGSALGPETSFSFPHSSAMVASWRSRHLFWLFILFCDAGD